MRINRIITALLCGAIMFIASAASISFASAAEVTMAEVDAPSAILTDASTGTVLYEQNAHEHRPVASMVKIMTLTLAFEAVERGELSTDEQITVSENASSMGGSQAFLDAHAEYNAGELIKAAIVASANDACVALAERLEGSVDGFVLRMNKRAAELGMNDTNFVNCTGLPSPNQYSCAHDAALMFRALIAHDGYFEYSRIGTFDLVHPSGRTTMLTNTNKLIRAYEGCDGGKTGFTNEAGFCLSATAERNGTRLISVVTGAESSKLRNREICKLFDYGFANFETKQVIFGGIALDSKLSVPKAKEKEVSVAPAADAYFLTKKGNKAEFTSEAVYNDGISLPLAAGSVVGRMIVRADGEVIAESELITTADLNEPSYADIINEFVKNW